LHRTAIGAAQVSKPAAYSTLGMSQQKGQPPPGDRPFSLSTCFLGY
jgi:hypothetical protein